MNFLDLVLDIIINVDEEYIRESETGDLCGNLHKPHQLTTWNC